MAVLVASCSQDHDGQPELHDSSVPSTAPGDAGSDTADHPLDASPGATTKLDAGVDAAPSGPSMCVRNSDCETSAEAEQAKNLRCPSEVYCLAGRCHAACSTSCQDVRQDVNPCSQGAYCDHALKLCRFRPAKCQTAATCPTYKPPLADGGVGAWSCDDGACTYPGYQYPTQD